MEDSWTDEDNYDISWYNASATSFELSDAEDLAGLAMITNGELTAGDFEVDATLGGDYDDDERVLDDFSGKTITLKKIPHLICLSMNGHRLEHSEEILMEVLMMER